MPILDISKFSKNSSIWFKIVIYYKETNRSNVNRVIGFYKSYHLIEDIIQDEYCNSMVKLNELGQVN